MPWADLSQVTEAIRRLLDRNINLVIDPPPSTGTRPVTTVVASPPDQISQVNVVKTVSLYLYHAKEFPTTQNAYSPDARQTRHLPMGLQLHYVLTAHQRLNNQFDAVMEQRLFGWAVKTLHDYGEVSDQTMVAGEHVLLDGARNAENHLRIVMEKKEPDQAFAIWTTGERNFARLAAYYTVSLVLLEPEKPPEKPPLVIAVGGFVLPGPGAYLARTRSQLDFVWPPTGSQAIDCEPARPGVTSAGTASSRMQILGSNLTGGFGRELVLRSAFWSRRHPGLDGVAIAPPAGNPPPWVGWNVTFSPESIDIVIGPQVEATIPGAAPFATDVFPGTYRAVVETQVLDHLSGSPPRRMISRSNEIAFSVIPRITGDAAAPGNRQRLNIDGTFPLNVTFPKPAQVPAGTPATDRLEIQLAIDGQLYKRVATPPGPGEFRANQHSIVLHRNPGLLQAGQHNVRLSVEGADAQPYWITI